MPVLKKAPSLSTLFEHRNLDEDQSSSGIESDTNSSHESDHKTNATILQKTMQHENFQIYLKILAKYEQEFQKLYKITKTKKSTIRFSLQLRPSMLFYRITKLSIIMGKLSNL